MLFIHQCTTNLHIAQRPRMKEGFSLLTGCVCGLLTYKLCDVVLCVCVCLFKWPVPQSSNMLVLGSCQMPSHDNSDTLDCTLRAC